MKVQADGSLIQLNEVEKIPGEHYVFQIKAPQGTRLGLLSVDQSVYLLRNENRLTKERVSTLHSRCLMEVLTLPTIIITVAVFTNFLEHSVSAVH